MTNKDILLILNKFELDLENNLRLDYKRTYKCISILMKQKGENEDIQDRISYIRIKLEKYMHNYKIAYEILEIINNKDSKKYSDILNQLQSSLCNHIKSIKKDIDIALNTNNNTVDIILRKAKEQLPVKAYEEIKDYIKDKKQLYKDEQINKLINSRNFNIAFNLALETKSLEKIDEIINIVKKEIFLLVRQDKDAITFINSLNNKLNIEIKKYYEILDQISKKLQKYDFISCRNFYDRNQNYIKKTEYLELKSHYIKEYFKNVKNIEINEEQTNSIAKESQNILITARAGSGKTRTIACRAIFAIEKENINPEEIMILAFNTKAAQEITTRINSNFNYKKIIARTFDSLAYGIIHPKEEILIDASNNQLTNFIKKLYISKNIWNQNFEERIYNLYREDNPIEMQELLSKDFSKNTLYEYYRNKRKITLDNIKVKSNGEKWIADFLFEHNINYKYEKLLTQNNSQLYKPDFTIFDNISKQEIILEHWGIDENDKFKKVPKYWVKTWDEYYNEMIWKRNLCKQKGKILVETSIIDLANGRKHFEKLLKHRLEAVGIKCKKLSKEEILNKIERKYKDKVALGFAQFIQRAEKERFSPNNIKSQIDNIALSTRNKEFIKLSIMLYDEYPKKLKEEGKTDFGNIMIRAIGKIHETQGECNITIGKKSIKIKDIKFLLIDEFQDFSKLFYEMINAIKKYNPNLKLFCVGDDWQAINGFAGSNLQYFKNFKNLFITDSEQGVLTYNYRSTSSIVEIGNDIMKGVGTPAKCFNSEKNGEVNVIYIDNTGFNIDDKEDSQYMYDIQCKKYFNTHHRYFKECYKIILNNLDKTFIIMHRTNYLCQYYDLFEFKNKLIKLLYTNTGKNFKNQIRVDTIHRFKGSEADIVIILECTNNNFPLIHPDSERSFVFGNTIEDIINEEKRLFYVAVTRAKEQVYFLTEKHNESEYLKCLKSINYKLNLDLKENIQLKHIIKYI